MTMLLLRKYWLPLLLVALGLAAAAACYRSGHKAGSAKVQAEWNEAKKAAAEAVAQAKDQDIDKGQQASIQYQEQKANEKERIRIVRQVVTRTVTGECFDAGSLQHLNEAIRHLPTASAAR